MMRIGYDAAPLLNPGATKNRVRMKIRVARPKLRTPRRSPLTLLPTIPPREPKKEAPNRPVEPSQFLFVRHLASVPNREINLGDDAQRKMTNNRPLRNKTLDDRAEPFDCLIKK